MFFSCGRIESLPRRSLRSGGLSELRASGCQYLLQRASDDPNSCDSDFENPDCQQYLSAGKFADRIDLPTFRLLQKDLHSTIAAKRWKVAAVSFDGEPVSSKNLPRLLIQDCELGLVIREGRIACVQNIRYSRGIQTGLQTI